ncbi:MAG: flavin reductase family protein, partial [Desulfovibrionaceae bacterium]|nr:flavin reductase family protein [Desulfovibrionaceae bacterium]
MKKSLGAKTLVWPAPVFLVGSYDIEDKPNIMNAAWGGICSSEPPALAVSVRPSRHTYEGIMRHKAFTVSIPSARLTREADLTGIVSGSRLDKFTACGFTA